LDSPQFQFSPWNFTTGQILNLIMILVGVLCFFLFQRRDRLERQRQEERQQTTRLSGRKLRKRLR
jgi:prolipoprotein diacylglyceryltransferase